MSRRPAPSRCLRGALPRRDLWIAGLAGFALLFIACGGGGGGPGVPAGPSVIDIGLQSATLPSTAVHTFRNPFGSRATVTALPSEGALEFAPDAFPISVGGGGTFTLAVRFTPTGAGPTMATAALRFASGSESTTRTFELRATGEPLAWGFSQNPLDFGTILFDLERERTLTITNGSQQSPVVFTNGNVTGDTFAIMGSPFPLSIPAGASASIDLRYSPSDKVTSTGTLTLGTGDAGGPLSLSVRGTGSGSGEQVIDLGMHDYIDGITPYVFFDVPTDAISVQVEARGAPNDELSLQALEGPGGEVFNDGDQAGPTRWFPARQAFAARIPDGDRSDVKLIAGGGRYAYRIRRSGGSSSSCHMQVILERRENPTITASVLDLNVFFAPAVPFTAATAPADAAWGQVLTRLRAIFTSVGINVRNLDYYDLSEPIANDPALSQVPLITPMAAMATNKRLSVFITRSMEGGSLLGFSAALGGAKDLGLRSNGVFAVVANQTTNTLGMTIAHEIAHYLGIWHTTEGDGTFDRLTDTPECPVFGTSAECPTVGGGQLMHFQVSGGQNLSNAQAMVMRGHPFVEPAAGGGTPKARPSLPPLTQAELERLRTFYANGCGTCRADLHR